MNKYANNILSLVRCSGSNSIFLDHRILQVNFIFYQIMSVCIHKMSKLNLSLILGAYNLICDMSYSYITNMITPYFQFLPNNMPIKAEFLFKILMSSLFTNSIDTFCQYSFHICQFKLSWQLNNFCYDQIISTLDDVGFLAVQEFYVTIFDIIPLHYTYGLNKASIRYANEAFILPILCIMNTDLLQFLCSYPSYLIIYFITLGMSLMLLRTMSYFLKLPLFTPGIWSRRPSTMSTYSVINIMIPNTDLYTYQIYMFFTINK